jgi:protein-tyrosine phosphatase
MIDLHSHVLPGLDDGAQDWAMALEMMVMAEEAGTEILVATPHTHDMWHGGEPCSELIPTLAHEATLRARRAGLSLQVLPGQECYIDDALPQQLNEGKWLTLGNSKTVLLELGWSHWPPFIDKLVFDLQLAGYRILLAHPERYRSVLDDPNLIVGLVEKGVLTQVTSASILGRFGESAQETARALLEHNLAHVLSSDAHTTRGRNPKLSTAREQVADWFGEEFARKLVLDTPRALLNDEPITLPEPRSIVRARKKVFGIF